MTIAELLAFGLSHSAVRKRVRRGALVRRYPGVYSVGPVLSREGEWLAAVLAIGADAALSHLSAATLCRAWRYPEQLIDVLVGRRHKPIDGIRLHQCRSLDPRDVYVYRGIRVTTVARMLVDLTDVLIPEELTNVISECAYRKCFHLAATRRAMGRANGRHNLGVLDQAIEDYLNGSAGLKSRKELAFLSLARAAGLPRPRVNTKLLGIEVDFHWRDRRVVVEVDGEGHKRPPTQRDDARRDAQLRAAGWTVLRFTADEIEQRPEEVRAALSAVL